MSQRVLFVDDEQALLNGVQRRLSGDYDLMTANAGDAGLAAMDQHGPFAVIVTDMRMPKMDGIEFIRAARAKSPDSVYIMLTGNQDQATAIQALNEGQVFRFLTKPCQSADLKSTIDAGLRQYQLVTGEKELLHKTFVGAVSVLTDVLELAQPSVFGRAERIQEIVSTLQKGLGLEAQWEYKLAARLAMLGFALLPEQERMRFEIGSLSGADLNATIRGASAIGQRIIERIPRLGAVAQIIGMQATADGSAVIPHPKNDQERAVMGATLLRVAIEWDALVRQGLSAEVAAGEVRQSLPRLSPRISQILVELEFDDVGEIGIEVGVSQLEEGMILLDDVLTSDGVMLIRSGRRLTWTIIEKLRSYQANPAGLRPVRVRSASLVELEPALT
jgi:response regulator RpfG family c-di-GMP phosphodiesterase